MAQKVDWSSQNSVVDILIPKVVDHLSLKSCMQQREDSRLDGL